MKTKTPAKNAKATTRAARIRRDAARVPCEPEAPCAVEYAQCKDGTLKLNIGSSYTSMPGYVNIDAKFGHSVYPLPDFVKDESADEIYASHILEHFGHQNVQKILGHWVSKLKPGGRIRIAVPDFYVISKAYQEGLPTFNPQGYVMGGQVDQYDVHGTLFDEPLLTQILVAAGLERIHRWKSGEKDCSALPISLNLEGYKPLTKDLLPHGVTAFLSAPRFGPVMHFRVAAKAFSTLGIPYNIGQGSMWHQVLCEQMEQHVARPEVEFLLTCDYDTVFDASDVVGMWRLMRAYEGIDALVPVQSKRSCNSALLSMMDDNGNHRRKIGMHEFDPQVTKIFSGHFGLTMFRASALRDLPRPWMVGIPHKETGRWQDDEYPKGKIDPDIHFWHVFRDAGKKAYLANNVRVGHLEEVITWPNGKDFTALHQHTNDYELHGRPAEVSCAG